MGVVRRLTCLVAEAGEEAHHQLVPAAEAAEEVQKVRRRERDRTAAVVAEGEWPLMSGQTWEVEEAAVVRRARPRTARERPVVVVEVGQQQKPSSLVGDRATPVEAAQVCALK